jgi:uncharacterized protein
MISSKQIHDLHKKYAPNDQELELVLTHCQVVAEIAVWAAKQTDEEVDLPTLETACLLHDIGSYPFRGASTLDKSFKNSYPLHALLGAKILKDEGFPEEVYNIVETHVLLGVTAEEIEKMGWAMPVKDYEPTTIEGELLCFADRFHSKTPKFNEPKHFCERLRTDPCLPDQADKFEQMIKKYGLPDINVLAQKYGHPIE